jgi:hypothetical protein
MFTLSYDLLTKHDTNGEYQQTQLNFCIHKNYMNLDESYVSEIKIKSSMTMDHYNVKNVINLTI